MADVFRRALMAYVFLCLCSSRGNFYQRALCNAVNQGYQINSGLYAEIHRLIQVEKTPKA
jgi:hypothetical protein